MANDLLAIAFRPCSASLRAPRPTPHAPLASAAPPGGHVVDVVDIGDIDDRGDTGDTGVTGDGPEAWALGGGVGLLGGGVCGAVGVPGVGEAGREDGWPGPDGGEGFAVPGWLPWPPAPPWLPPAPGSGPDGFTGRDGVAGSDGVGVASTEASPAFSSPPAGSASPLRPSRRGPSPRPSTVTPPGPGRAPLPSGRTAPPAGFGWGGSLMLIQPARDAASAETATAATVTRESARPLGEGDGSGTELGSGAAGGVGDE